jgi:hypothetical protein
MSGQTIIRSGLESLYFTGAHWALKPFVGGIGAILTLHHVRPPRPDRFQPNRILEVTPRFLTRVVKLLARSGIDVISLDEMYRRMTERDFGRRFVCLTFDDGYRDNLEFAYPILREAGFPFAVYVPTSFPDRLGELWWLVLEAVIAKRDRVGLAIDGENRSFDCGSVAEKRALYDELTGGCARATARPSCGSSCAIWRCVIRSMSPRSARICAWAGRRSRCWRAILWSPSVRTRSIIWRWRSFRKKPCVRKWI